MRRFENLKMVLFDSTKASFKLAVETQFTRGNRDQGYTDLVYITKGYTGMLNPNIYLTLTYKDETTTPVYTSYPQLFRLREAFEKIKDLVAEENVGFMDIDGQISVRPEHMEPVILSNIGKNNNWISLKLAVIQSGENGVITTEPGVSIELSTSNRFASILSIDEFLTVYTIVKDLDLSLIQCMMSLAYLDVEKQQGFQQSVSYNNQQQYQQQYYQQPAAPRAYPQQPQYNQAPVQQGYYQQPQQPQYNQAPRARYNNNAPQPMRRQSVESPKTDLNLVTPDSDALPYMHNPNQPAMPPRNASKPIMNMGAVEATPISEISFEDPGLDEIFNQ